MLSLDHNLLSASKLVHNTFVYNGHHHHNFILTIMLLSVIQINYINSTIYLAADK